MKGESSAWSDETFAEHIMCLRMLWLALHCDFMLSASSVVSCCFVGIWGSSYIMEPGEGIS